LWVLCGVLSMSYIMYGTYLPSVLGCPKGQQKFSKPWFPSPMKHCPKRYKIKKDAHFYFYFYFIFYFYFLCFFCACFGVLFWKVWKLNDWFDMFICKFMSYNGKDIREFSVKLWACFHLTIQTIFEWGLQKGTKFLSNLGMKCWNFAFDAQGLRVTSS
jgi:hypothetical protein